MRRYWQKLDQSRALRLLLMLAALRCLTVVVLVTAGPLKPFIGYNAETGFLPLAERLLSTGTYNDPSTWEQAKYTPGYPLIIASVRAVGFSPAAAPKAIVVLQNLCDAVTALITFLLARRLSSPLAALLAGALWLLFPMPVLLSTWITTETVFGTLFLASLYPIAIGGTPSVAQMAASGAAMALAIYVRPTPLLLAPVLALLVWWKLGFKRAAAYALCCAALVMPWVVRNRLVLNDNIGVAISFASTFLQGSDPATFDGSKKTAIFNAWDEEAKQKGWVKPPADRASPIEAWMIRLALEQYRKRWHERPWSFPGFALLKFARLWYGTESGSTARHGILFVLAVVYGLPGLVLFARRWLRTRPLERFDWVTLATLGYFIALHMVTLPMIRYMLPVFPLLLIGTGMYLAEVLDKAVPEQPQPAPLLPRDQLTSV